MKLAWIAPLWIVGSLSLLVAQDPAVEEAAISFAPKSTVFKGTLSIRIVSSQPVRFTVDGSTPTTDSPIYSAPIEINRTSRIRASPVDSDDERAIIHEADYVQVDSSLETFSSPLPIIVIENFGQGAIHNKRTKFGGDGSGIKQVPRQFSAMYLFEQKEGAGNEAKRTAITPESLSLATRMGIRVRGSSSAFQPEGKKNYSVESWLPTSDTGSDITPLWTTRRE